MESISTLEEFYSSLDLNAFQLEMNWKLHHEFLKFKNQTTSDDEKQKMQWELECCLFTLIGNKVLSFAYSTGENGEDVSKYPNLEDFQKEAFEHIKIRAKQTHNPFLKARYNHILWKAPRGIKNKAYAVEAIQAYIVTIKKFIELNEANGEAIFKASQLFEKLIALCSETKECYIPAIDLTNHILFSSDRIDFNTKHSIISTMLKYPKIFEKSNFSGTLNLFEVEPKEIIDSEKMQWVWIYIPTAIKLAQILETDVNVWHNLTGDIYLILGNNEVREDRSMIKSISYVHAIHAFKKAGNKEKVKEAEQLNFEAKDNLRLNKVQIRFSEKRINEKKKELELFEKIAKALLKQSSDAVYEFILHGEFFPKHDIVQNIAKGTIKDFTPDIGTIVTFDKNKNINFPDREEEELRNFYNEYYQQIDDKALPLLHFLIIHGIKSGKLTANNFISFLKNNTWLGMSFTYTNLSGDKMNITYLGLIAPSIHYYFQQVFSWANSHYYKPDFILCIDSLTVKMEGLFRSFCQLINISTTVGTPEGSTREAYIHNVLENPIIKEYFTTDDITFFKYLFANEGGINLRNNVAHSFYHYNEYSSDLMNLLLAALLRLAKYNFKETSREK